MMRWPSRDVVISCWLVLMCDPIRSEQGRYEVAERCGYKALVRCRYKVLMRSRSKVLVDVLHSPPFFDCTIVGLCFGKGIGFLCFVWCIDSIHFRNGSVHVGLGRKSHCAASWYTQDETNTHTMCIRMHCTHIDLCIYRICRRLFLINALLHPQAEPQPILRAMYAFESWPVPFQLG